jgi:hypothetical protein
MKKQVGPTAKFPAAGHAFAESPPKRWPVIGQSVYDSKNHGDKQSECDEAIHLLHLSCYWQRFFANIDKRPSLSDQFARAGDSVDTVRKH